MLQPGPPGTPPYSAQTAQLEALAQARSIPGKKVKAEARVWGRPAPSPPPAPDPAGALSQELLGILGLVNAKSV